MWHDHDIDFARWLHTAMWHVALESWQWIHQVAAPCSGAVYSDGQQMSALSCATVLDLDFVKCPQNCVMAAQ